MIQHGRFIEQEYRHVLSTTYCMCILWHCSLHSSSTWKKLLWISKGHAITLFQEFNMTGTIGHEYKILLWLQGQYFKGWRFKHLRDNKIKNSNKAQRFSSEFVYLFHCVIYTRVQCSYVSRTDFLDKQILTVVTWLPFTLCLLSWCFHVEICIYWRIFMLRRSHFILLISFTELLFITPDWSVLLDTV